MNHTIHNGSTQQIPLRQLPFADEAKPHFCCRECWAKSVICNCNLAIPHLQTEMGNSPIPFAEFMVHYSPTAKDVKFSMDIKWIRKFMFIH